MIAPFARIDRQTLTTGGKQSQPATTPIAYIMSRFPKLSETFILRELLELERQGQAVVIFPLLRSKEAVHHQEVSGLVAQAHYTPFLSPAILAANAHYFRRAPRAYIKLLWSALRGTWGSTNLFIGAIGIFPKSVYLARLIEARGISHIHAHFATHPALAALIIAQLTGASFSFTAHAHDIFVHRRMLGEKLKRASLVVTISEFNRRYLLQRYPDTPAARIKVVHCGVEPERFAGRRQRADDRFTIICVANLQPYKGIEFLLHACALLQSRLDPFRCIIIGEGMERPRLERQVAELGLQHTVELRGGQPQDKVAELLAGADLFVLPSVLAADGQMDGIPVALMEAMAAGLPVVATRLSGIPELVQDGINGLLVPPGNAVALAGAITTLYQNESLRRAMGGRGRKQVASEFNLTENIKRLRGLFAEVMDKRMVTAGKTTALPDRLKDWINECVPQIEDGTAADHSHRIAGGKDSDVHEIRADHRRQAGRTLILKLHKGTGSHARQRAQVQARREHDTLVLLYEQFSRKSSRLEVPKPLGLLPEFAAVLMERCEGKRLDGQLRWARMLSPPWQRHRLCRQLEQCGEWLGLFHQITARQSDPTHVYQRIEQDFHDDLGACRNTGLMAELTDRVADAFERRKADLFTGRHLIVGQHCDFGPYNVFVSPARVCVIDFEGFGEGVIYDDVCYFLGMLEAMPAYHLSRDLLARLQDSFLKGYGRYHDVNLQELEIFMLATMAKIMGRNPWLKQNPRNWHDDWKQRERKALYAAWFTGELQLEAGERTLTR